MTADATPHKRLSADADVEALRRVAETTAFSVYEMRYLDDGRYECTSFIGEGVARLLGGCPDGMSEEDAYEQAVHPDDRIAYDQVAESLHRLEPTELEYRLLGYDGKTRWVWERCVPRTTVAGEVIVHGVAIDVTSRHKLAEELAETQARLAHLAYHDPLTGLANRLHFHERLEQTLQRAGSSGGEVGVLLVDLDGFKRVNDEWGHATGDELLCHVAKRLAAALRDGDLLGRLGGDEFLALIDCSDASATAAGDVALEVAGRMRSVLIEPITLSNASATVTASVGISTYPKHASTATELIHQADVAMYLEKRDRRQPRSPLAA
jgi:diguanylate cyclase (GGDEF)-like protein/PAS domain S-box-containing protein